MITVYGASWCGDTQRTLRYLKQSNTEFDYRDIDQDEQAAQWVRDHNDGKRKLPTLDLNGKTLTVPSNDELQAALGSA